MAENDIYSQEFNFIKKTYKYLPSSILFDGYFNIVDFDNFLKKNNVVYINKEKDIVDNHVDIKCLCDIGNNIYISYVQIEDEEQNGLIIDLIMYYNISTVTEEQLKSITDDINKTLIIVDENEDNQNKIINLLSYSYANGYTLTPKYIESFCDFDSEFYNDNVIVGIKDFIQGINTDSNNIYVLCGEKGLGKTNVIRFITDNVAKNIIFIPINMVDHIIQPEFQKFIDNMQNCVFIIEDVEMYVTNTYSRNPMLVKTIVQNCKGFLSDTNSNDYIISINCLYKDIVDADMLSSSKFMVFDRIDSTKASKIAKKLSVNFKAEKGKYYTLSDVKNNVLSKKIKIGF